MSDITSILIFFFDAFFSIILTITEEVNTEIHKNSGIKLHPLKFNLKLPFTDDEIQKGNKILELKVESIKH
jgi:hypothetical protein